MSDTPESRPYRVYRRVRPWLADLGVLTATRALFPAGLRRRMAQQVGLAGFPTEQATGRRLPGWARERTKPQALDGVNLIGDLRADFGLSQATRSLQVALTAANIPTAYHEIAYHGVRRSHAASALPSGTPHGVNLIDINFPAYASALTRDAAHHYRDKALVAYWSWELAAFPTLPPSTYALMDVIWTNSHFSAASIGAVAPVPVVPMSFPVIVNASPNAGRSLFGLPDERFIYLFAFDAASNIARKNPFGLIEAFGRAFPDVTQRPLLVIKAHDSSGSTSPPLWDDLRAALARVDGLLLDGYWPRQRIIDLLAVCDCYVSLHRAEGFGLSIAEAMALGKPTIATGWSGNADYMTPQNSYPVNYLLRPITPDDHRYQPTQARTYPPGVLWAEPDLDHAAAQMHAVHEQRDVASAKGAQAARDIAHRYGIDPFAQRMREQLEALLHG